MFARWASKAASGIGRMFRHQENGGPPASWKNGAVFIAGLDRLIKLRDFVYRESITIKQEDLHILNIGLYSSFVYHKKGADVTEPDWTFLEERTRILMGYTTPDSLRRFELLFAPRVLFWLPIALAGVAALALAASVFPPQLGLLDVPGWLGSLFSHGNNVPGTSPTDAASSLHSRSWRLFAYLVWCISLGAIGAISFLYVNALSIQIDKNVDVTNKNFVTMRVILVALFGVVLDLPLGYPAFVNFCASLAVFDPVSPISPAATPIPSPSAAGINVEGGAFLLLPFLIGFSTPLMINILNRLVEALQGLFGIKNESPPAAT